MIFLYISMVGMIIAAAADRVSRNFCICLIISLGIGLSALNAFRIVDSDLIIYMQYLNGIENFYTESIANRAALEPVLGYVKYFFSSTDFSDEYIKFLLSCLVLIGPVIFILAAVRGRSIASVELLFLIAICFNFVYFNQSLHILRQMLGLSFFLVYLAFPKKTCGFLFLIISSQSHSIFFVLSIIILCHQIYYKKSERTTPFITLLLLIFLFFTQGSFDYVIARAENINQVLDQNFNLLIVMVCASLLSWMLLKRHGVRLDLSDQFFFLCLVCSLIMVGGLVRGSWEVFERFSVILLMFGSLYVHKMLRERLSKQKWLKLPLVTTYILSLSTKVAYGQWSFALPEFASSFFFPVIF